MNLKERIVKSGIKQTKIAELIGITPEYLNLMINGKQPMSEEIRNKINEVLIKVSI
jgi:plasmid maintenance system antidote protein VapI